MKQKVDYGAGSSRGGDIANIPEPHQRMFPGRRKRKVRVSITRFYGVGIHFYASLREESNMIWCACKDAYQQKPHWHQAWDDREGNGREFSGRFNTHEAAQDFINRTAAKEFPAKTHRILADFGQDKAPKWFYRDGD